MPVFQVPAINQSICAGWSQQSRDLYQKLPYYLAKTQVDYMKTWNRWKKLTGTFKWKPNQGNTVKTERKVPSPHIRQHFYPQPLTGTPKVDVLGVRSTTVDEVLYWNHFESQNLEFQASFADFMTDHVERTRLDIQEKITRAEDLFIRSKIFHQSPKVWIANRAGGEMLEAPVGNGNDTGTSGKTTAWLQLALTQLGQPGNLSFDTLSRLLTAASTDIRMPAFVGNMVPKDEQGLTGKYALVCSTEAFEHFSFDPYVKANKTLDFDIVTGSFKGSFFGRITCLLEDMPLRMAEDGSFPIPETIEMNPDAYNYGETIPNINYTDPNLCPYEWAFFVGASGYDAIESGPPPSEFTSQKVPEGFGNLMWNGEIQMTKDIFVPCIDQDGNVTWQPNKYGKYLQLISTMTFGCLPKQRRYVIPILFKRVRGNTNLP